MPNRDGKTTVAVIFGGRSSEYSVSLASAASVVSQLDRSRYEVILMRITPEGEWAVGSETLPAGTYTPDDLVGLTSAAGVPVSRSISGAVESLGTADVAIPTLHGPYGEDGTVQGLLELMGVPYVGNGVLASAAGMDKDVTKRLLAASGLPVAESVLLEEPHATLSPEDRDRLGLPVFVKPARAGSSLGVSRVDHWDELPAALDAARALDSKVLVEEGVIGREIDVAVLQHPDGRVEAGPPLEISVSDTRHFFDHEAKYQDPGTRFQVPADLDKQTTTMLGDLALRIFETLTCRGLLRVDFFLRGGTEPVVNEVNTFPGFTSASQFPQIWAATGLPYAELLDILVTTALTQPKTSDTAPHNATATADRITTA